MSERAKQKSGFQFAQEQKKKVQQQILELSEVLNTWERAEQTLSTEPRKLVNTAFVLHYVPTIVNTVQEGTCAECGEESAGYTSKWSWCPVCGAKFTKVETESTPQARLMNKAVQEARAAMITRNEAANV